jgi:50S ribosomal protein L16 3-hydroxylase
MRGGVLTRLGDVGVGEFLRRYWQREPLLVRGAFPDFRAPVGRDRLCALAGREEVESRLVTRTGRHWSLRQGPFARHALPPAARPGWTLLVQGLDLIDAGAHELLSRFRFLPDARLDDLMGSFASDRGGVGPHVDNYDVFLLQAQGRRRWRISRQRNLALRPGQPLKLLARFRPSWEQVLEPGDLLYLPPGIAHDGVAEGPCLTYSIGFRAPTYDELLDPWLADFARHSSLTGRYADPGQRATAHPGELPRGMVRRVHAALVRVRPTRADTERFLLEHLTEPKMQVVFRAARPALTLAAFRRAARRRGVALDRRSRMLIGRNGVGLNGELFAIPASLRTHLRRLADERALPAAALAAAPASLMALLHDWQRAAWLRLGPEPASAHARTRRRSGG